MCFLADTIYISRWVKIKDKKPLAVIWDVENEMQSIDCNSSFCN